MSESTGMVSVSRRAIDSDGWSSRLSTPDPALEASFRAQLHHTYDASVRHPTDVDPHVTLEGVSSRSCKRTEPGVIEEYEFRLFSRPKSEKATNPNSGPQRIAIRSPTPINGDPGFVIQRRPDSYYFTGPLDTVRTGQIRAAAVSGEEILKGVDLKWRGCELPWRVTVVKAGQSKGKSKSDRISVSASNTKKRIGKKRRIAIRKKMHAIRDEVAAARQSQAEKEAVEKEKRTRRNREKKVKKKQKEKLEKQRKAREGQDAG